MRASNTPAPSPVRLVRANGPSAALYSRSSVRPGNAALHCCRVKPSDRKLCVLSCPCCECANGRWSQNAPVLGAKSSVFNARHTNKNKRPVFQCRRDIAKRIMATCRAPGNAAELARAVNKLAACRRSRAGWPIYVLFHLRINLQAISPLFHHPGCSASGVPLELERKSDVELHRQRVRHPAFHQPFSS